MAAAASKSGVSIFSIYYQGPQTSERYGKISGIALTPYKGADQSHFAKIDETTNTRLPLVFLSPPSDTEKAAFKGTLFSAPLKETTFIKMTPATVKTMEIGVRFFQRDEDGEDLYSSKLKMRIWAASKPRA